MRFIAPIAAGLLLDAIDLMTFGPVGLWTGLAIGGAAGWLLSPYLGFSDRHRWLCALLAGVYCTLPFTSFVPLAGVLATAANFLRLEPGPVSRHLPSDGETPAIDAEYRAHWDEEPNSQANRNEHGRARRG
jgi:hypothetical protein